MKRYFYTDPLVAAWMAKHFGMGFCGASESSPYYETVLIYIGNATFAAAYNDRAGIYYAGDFITCKCYYIQPDSLHLLEPQAGDLIHDLGGEYLVVWEDHKGLVIKTRIGTASPKGRILQRNGKPFMWPEEEA